MSNEGGERMGITGGEPMSGDIPNEPFPDCAEPFCEHISKTLIKLRPKYNFSVTSEQLKICGQIGVNPVVTSD